MIYLDHNATSPLDPRVLERMLPYLRERWGNASSRDHAFGWDARDAVEEARFRVAELIHAQPREIFFTSGASESLATALFGLFPWGNPEGTPPGPSGRADSFSAAPAPVRTPEASAGIAATAVEHEAVLAPCRRLEARGVPFRLLPVDAGGNLDLAALAAADEKPKAICIQAANNETGVLFPIRRAAALAHARGAMLIVDAAQALGRFPLDAREDGFDLAAFSAHKLYGPQGVGALYVRGGLERTPLEALIPGGGQEGGLRGGTLNVAAIVGFGEACRLAGLEMAGETARLLPLRDRLEGGLMAAFPQIRINGAGDRLPNTSNLVFPGADARLLIRDMHDVAVSTRSACASGSGEASHVLRAMGLSEEGALASIRFSLGRGNTEAEIDTVIEKASASYRKLLGIGALSRTAPAP